MLRGTVKRRRTLAKPTLQNQITALKRQVARNKPELQHFRIASNWSSGASTASAQINLNVTETLINSSDFRDNVTGDLWSNARLDFRTYLTPDCNQFRILIYVPKRAGQRFVPSSYKFVDIPDPTAFTIYHDKTYSRDYDVINSNNTKKPHEYVHRIASLRNMLTKYNSESATIEKGEIIISIIYDPQTALTLQGDYSYMLTYTNK